MTQTIYLKVIGFICALCLMSASASAMECQLIGGQFLLSSSEAGLKAQARQRISLELKSNNGCTHIKSTQRRCESTQCIQSPGSLGLKGPLYSYRLSQVGKRYVLVLFRSLNGEAFSRLSRWQDQSVPALFAQVGVHRPQNPSSIQSQSARSASGKVRHSTSLGVQFSPKGAGFHLQTLDFNFPTGFRLVGLNFGFQGDFGAMTTSVKALSSDEQSLWSLDEGAYTMVIGLAGLGFNYRIKKVLLQGVVYPLGVMTYWRKDEIDLSAVRPGDPQEAIEQLFSYRRYITYGLLPIELGAAYDFNPNWFVAGSVAFPLIAVTVHSADSPHADDETVITPVGSIRLGVKF